MRDIKQSTYKYHRNLTLLKFLVRDSGMPLGVVLNGVMKREEAEATLDQVICSTSLTLSKCLPVI